MEKVSVGIIDDGYPNHEFSRFSIQEVSEWITEDWRSEKDLLDLNIRLLNEVMKSKGRIYFKGFRHPNFFAAAEEKKLDYLIYDWEYAPECIPDEYFLSILKSTNSYIFIYSAWDKIDKIPEVLQNERFNAYRNRYKILSKSEPESNQEILAEIERKYYEVEKIQYNKISINFVPSKYITGPQEIWKLEFLLGKENIEKYFMNYSNEINEKTITDLFKKSTYSFYIDDNKQVVSASKNPLLESKLGNLNQISMYDAAASVGIDILEEAKEHGYAELK